jgi:hypothetical protein
LSETNPFYPMWGTDAKGNRRVFKNRAEHDAFTEVLHNEDGSEKEDEPVLHSDLDPSNFPVHMKKKLDGVVDVRTKPASVEDLGM